MPGGLSQHGTSSSTGTLAYMRSVSFSSDTKALTDGKRKQLGKCNSGSKRRVSQVREIEAHLGPVVMEDVIEFTSPIFYANEEEGHLSIEVLRLGSAVGKATVDYATRDGSAVAGCKYEATSGTIEFDAGERRKTIHVKILSDDAFDATLEFALCLDNACGARLGKYLHECRISILDDDAFPTNKYKTLLNAGLASEIPSWPLIWEYLYMHLEDRGMRAAFIATLIFDQISNMKFVWAILLTNYMVDKILKPPEGEEPPEHADTRVYIVVALSFVPHCLLFLMDRFKAYRRIGGRAVSKLQQNLVRKFLNYDEKSRALVSGSDLQMAITRDVPELVEGAFSSVFGIVRKAGLLLILLSIQIQKIGGEISLTAALFFGFPLLTCIFLYLRQGGTTRRRDSVFRCETELVSYVQETTECYRLINDYMQRPTMIKLFAEKVVTCNRAKLSWKVWNLTNKAFTPALTTVMCGIFVLFSYRKVLDGGPLGEFLTGCAIWKGIGDCYQEIFADARELQSAIAPLQNIVYYMNLPVDIPQKMQRVRQFLDDSRHGIQVADAQLAKIPSQDHSPFTIRGTTITTGCFNDEAAFSTDLLQIVARSISFAYPKKEAGVGGNTVICEASFEIPQGKLVAVTGPRGSGKATLLNIIGNVLPLEEQHAGKLFIPPHLRVLNVGQDAQSISDLDLFDNLCFGPPDAGDQDPKRIMEICRRLGMSHEIIRVVEEHADVYKSETPEQKKAGFKSKLSSAAQSSLSHLGHLEHSSSGGKIHLGTVHSVTKRRGAELMANAGSILSQTDRILIHLARAFIMNPDVLILHKPLSQLDEYRARLVLDLLREFVDLRGIEKSPEGRLLRRPRTCIFSVADSRYADVADKVYHVAHGNVSLVDIHELETLRHHARKLFEAMDLNCDNLVNRKEFVEAVQGAPWATELLGVPKDESSADSLNDIFDLLDRSSNGEVDFDDLVQSLRGRFDGALPQALAALHVAPASPDHNAGQDLLMQAKSTVTYPLLSSRSQDAWALPEIAIEVPMFTGGAMAHDLHGADQVKPDQLN